MMENKPAVLRDHEVIGILKKDGIQLGAGPIRIMRSAIKKSARSIVTAITVEAGSKVFHLIEKVSSGRELDNAAFLLSRSLPVPRIYYMDRDRSILLTEDVHIGSIQGGEFDENTENGGYIRLGYLSFMEAAAQFHSAFWEDGQAFQKLGLPWHATHYREHVQGLEKEFAAYKKQQESWQAVSGLKCLEKSLELLANRDIHAVNQRFLTGKDMTLIHGDLHPGNMFISTEDRSVRMIDYEAMRMGVCTDDLAMLVAYHIAPNKRDAMPLLRHYHAHLAKRISGYGFDKFVSDYCISILENMFFSIRLINHGIPAFNIRDASFEAFRSFILESAALPADAISHTVSPMTEADAAVIAAWAYPPPYDIYSMDASSGCMEELADGSYYAVRDGKGTLAGFYCFGASARVPAGDKLHAYDESGLMDIGLGMAPSLCGKGFGQSFLNGGLAFGREALSASAFRLTVAAFNKRAIRVYEKAGFLKTGSFLRTAEKGSMEFIVMVLRQAA